MSPKSKGHFRSSPRPQIACKVTIRRQADPSEEIIAYTRDIGLGGVFVETSEPLDEGEVIDVSLAAPSKWEPLVLKASVCRIEAPKGGEPGGVGLRFEHLSENQTIALSELAASLDYEE